MMFCATVDASTLVSQIIGIAAIAVIVGIPIGAIVLKRRGGSRLASMISEALSAGNPGNDPIVRVRFHTYHGLIVFAIQTTHELSLPLPEARQLLMRLHKFNLTWGLFAYGVLVIPILSYFEYRSQLRSIERQAKALSTPTAAEKSQCF